MPNGISYAESIESAGRSWPLEPLEQQSTPERAAQRIREAILRGRFPPGTRLNEAQLASELHVSRAPVREAFQRLIQEGLLRGERNRGVFVVSLDQEDSCDVYFVRSVVERAAAVAVSERGDEDVLAELDALVDQMRQTRKRGWPELVDVDLAFHRYLVEAAGSPRLLRIFDNLSAETRLCLLHLERFYEDRLNLVQEHHDIAVAIRSGDRGAIERVISDHMDAAAARIKTTESP